MWILLLLLLGREQAVTQHCVHLQQLSTKYRSRALLLTGGKLHACILTEKGKAAGFDNLTKRTHTTEKQKLGVL